MAAAVVQFADFATGRLVVVQKFAGGIVQGFSEDQNVIVAKFGTQVF